MTSTAQDRLRASNSSLAFKAPCRVATTANITLSGEQTIDGVAVVTDDRVLVKDQTDQAENGIYIADTGDWSRAPDFDGQYDIVEGTVTYVTSGSAGQGFYYVSTTNPIVIDTSNITFGKASTVLATVSAYMQTVLDDTTAAAARTTLGAVGLTGNESVGGNKTMTGNTTFSGTATFSSTTTLNAGATVASGQQLVLPDGTGAAPSLKVGDEQNGLFSPAAGNLGIAVAGGEAMRVDSGGRLIASSGASAAVAFGSSASARFQALGTTSLSSGYATARYSADATAPLIISAKSRNATVGSHTVVQADDGILAIVADASDGTNFIRAGSIAINVDGTPGTNDMPGRIVMSTTADGASSATEAFRLDNAQEAYFPNIATTASAANAFLNSGSTPANQLLRSTSSLRYKTNLRPIPKAALDAILKLEPFKYRSKAKSDNPAWSYYGLGAEDVAKIDPRLVTWGRKVVSDKVESVTVEKEVEGTEIVTVREKGLPILKKVKVVKKVPHRAKARVVKYSDKLVPDGVMYERLTVMLLEHVKDLRKEVDELKRKGHK